MIIAKGEVVKKITLILMLCLGTAFSAVAQDQVTASIKARFDQKDYKGIVNEYAKQVYDLPAEAAYYIAMSYAQMNDDDDCVKYMNLVIQKAPDMAKAYYGRALSLSYIGEPEKSLQDIKKAISLDTGNSEYYAMEGDIYFKNDLYQQALEAYITATEKPNPAERSFNMIGQVFYESGEHDKALIAFYIAKDRVSKESPVYRNVLYNIALLENMKGGYENAETALKELLWIQPDNYLAYTKLIQSYYGMKQYDKAKVYIDKLYEARAAHKLKGEMATMFCFDEFIWKDRRVEAYQKFDEPEESGYEKIVFFILNGGKLDWKIQTEYYPGANGQKYRLAGVKAEYHYFYAPAYTAATDYETIKNDVVKVLNGQLQPVETTRAQ